MRVVGALESSARAVDQAQSIRVPAEVHEIVHLSDERAADFAGKTGLFEELDGFRKDRNGFRALSSGVENLRAGARGVCAGNRRIDQRCDVEIGFREDFGEIQIAWQEFANPCRDSFDQGLIGRILGVRYERPLLGSIPNLSQCGQIRLGT